MSEKSNESKAIEIALDVLIAHFMDQPTFNAGDTRAVVDGLIKARAELNSKGS